MAQLLVMIVLGMISPVNIQMETNFSPQGDKRGGVLGQGLGRVWPVTSAEVCFPSRLSV